MLHVSQFIYNFERHDLRVWVKVYWDNQIIRVKTVIKTKFIFFNENSVYKYKFVFSPDNTIAYFWVILISVKFSF